MSNPLRNLDDFNRLIHEPARLMIVTILYTVDKADFIYLLRETGMTRGNLSTHLTRLEEAGYIQIERTFRGKIPQTLCSLTDTGRRAFEAYRRWLKQFVESIP